MSDLFPPTASSLRILNDCTGYSLLPPVSIDNEYTEEGTRKHEVMEDLIDNKNFHEPLAKPWARDAFSGLEERGIDLGSARAETAYAYDTINKKPHYIGYKIKRAYDNKPNWVYGSADFDGDGWIGDWKFTDTAFDSIYAQLPPLESDQLKFLGSCKLIVEGLESVGLFLCKIRGDGEVTIETAQWDMMDAVAYLEGLSSKLREQPRFRTGPHCMLCGKFQMCTARLGVLQQFAPENRQIIINEETAPLIVERVVAASKAIEQAKEALDAYVEMTGQDIKVPGGFRYGKNKMKKRNITDPVKALTMLAEVLGTDAAKLLHTNPKMYIGELDDLASAHGKDPKELFAWLEKSGVAARVEFDTCGLYKDKKK